MNEIRVFSIGKIVNEEENVNKEKVHSEQKADDSSSKTNEKIGSPKQASLKL